MQPLNQKGMFLETVLNLTHQKYNEAKICCVSKIPINQFYNSLQKKNVFRSHDSCDYIGNYQGHYFEFEAKETYNDFFAWTQIRKNQLQKMELVAQTQGLAFLIIYFGSVNQFFFVEYFKLKNYVQQNHQKIPLQWFQKETFTLEITSELKLDYLVILNLLTN